MNMANDIVSKGIEKFESEGFDQCAWALPFPFQVHVLKKNEESVFIISPVVGDKSPGKSETANGAETERNIVTAPVTQDLYEFGIPDGLEVSEPLFARFKKGDAVKKSSFSSLYEYLEDAPHPWKLPSAEMPPLLQRLKKAFSAAAWPVVFDHIKNGKVAGPFRNRFNLAMGNGRIVQCSRYYIPGLEFKKEGPEDVAWAAAAGEREQKLVGIVSPFRAEDGSQRLIWGYTYRVDPPAPR
jgi:hypothetical protein